MRHSQHVFSTKLRVLETDNKHLLDISLYIVGMQSLCMRPCVHTVHCARSDDAGQSVKQRKNDDIARLQPFNTLVRHLKYFEWTKMFQRQIRAAGDKPVAMNEIATVFINSHSLLFRWIPTQPQEASPPNSVGSCSHTPSGWETVPEGLRCWGRRCSWWASAELRGCRRDTRDASPSSRLQRIAKDVV